METPEVQIAEGKSSVGDRTEVRRKEKDSGAANPADSHVRLRVVPGPKRQQRPVAEIQRWVVGAYRGSNKAKVKQLPGISGLRTVMQNRRVRWAASIYGRHLPEPRRKTEEILQSVLEEDSPLKWMRGVPLGDGVVR